jgi:prepilin-type N-terminal cleavage/methylation domain-containing protein
MRQSQRARNEPRIFCGGQRGRRRRGFSLVEVMIGTVLTAILVIGMASMWSEVDKGFLYLTVRQKAIFVLNGEMERLSALYRFTDFDTSDPSTATDQYTIPAGEDDFATSNPTRLIYSNPNDSSVIDEMVVNTSAVAATSTLFDCVNGTEIHDTSCAGRVFFDDNSNDTLDRNFVWIDQFRKIVGRLSWSEDSTIDADCFPVDGSSSCKQITLFLQYPFRYLDEDTPDGDIAIGKRETLSLMTIVGRR